MLSIKATAVEYLYTHMHITWMPYPTYRHMHTRTLLYTVLKSSSFFAFFFPKLTPARRIYCCWKKWKARTYVNLLTATFRCVQYVQGTLA